MPNLLITKVLLKHKVFVQEGDVLFEQEDLAGIIPTTIRRLQNFSGDSSTREVIISGLLTRGVDKVTSVFDPSENTHTTTIFMRDKEISATNKNAHTSLVEATVSFIKKVLL